MRERNCSSSWKSKLTGFVDIGNISQEDKTPPMTAPSHLKAKLHSNVSDTTWIVLITASVFQTSSSSLYSMFFLVQDDEIRDYRDIGATGKATEEARAAGA